MVLAAEGVSVAFDHLAIAPFDVHTYATARPQTPHLAAG
jgi:hypothetical protein